jgi:hypothetical protein
LPSTPGAPAVVPSAEFFCTAVLGVVWVPAAGPEVSPCAGSGAATEADALNSTIANAATEKGKVEHMDFIILPPLSRSSATSVRRRGLFLARLESQDLHRWRYSAFPLFAFERKLVENHVIKVVPLITFYWSTLLRLWKGERRKRR